jgi:hypothetical protein
MSNPATQFSKDRQPARRRGKDAIKKKCDLNEAAFYQEVADRAIKGKDVVLMKELLMRVSPVSRPVAPEVHFDFPENGSAVEQVDAILMATSLGKCPADVGQMLVNMIKAKLEILDISELADRLEAIERHLAQKE